MQPKRIAPSDLRATAQQLLRTGTLPKLDDFLGVLSHVRQKYGPQIKAARGKGVEAVDKAMEPLVNDATAAPDEFAVGGESSPVPPMGDITPPTTEMQPKSLLLGGRTGVAAPTKGRGATPIPPSSPTTTHGSKI